MSSGASHALVVLAMAGMLASVCSAADHKAKDLNPVKFKQDPSGVAVTVVQEGQAKASIAVMSPATSRCRASG